MCRPSFRRIAQNLVLVAALTTGLAVATFSGLTSSSPASVALANGNGNGNGNDNGDDNGNDNRSAEERVNLRGQALAILDPARGTGWAVAPGVLLGQFTPPDGLPALEVATIYGGVPVLLLGPNLIQESGLGLGDYVHLRGHYFGDVFVATRLTVTEKCCPRP